MFKSYTKPPVSQSCWLLLVLAWEEIQSGLSARTNNLRHSASRFSCHPPASQNDSDPSCAVLDEAPSTESLWLPSLPWNDHGQKTDMTERDSGPVYKGKSLFSTAYMKKDCLVLTRNKPPSGFMRNILVKLSVLPQAGGRWVWQALLAAKR